MHILSHCIDIEFVTCRSNQEDTGAWAIDNRCCKWTKQRNQANNADTLNKKPSCRPYFLTTPLGVTWRHQSRDHLIPHNVISYWWSFGMESLNLAVFEILCPKRIGVTSLTFQGHVTSSVTWQFDSPYAIFYWWSFGTKPLALTVFENSTQM